MRKYLLNITIVVFTVFLLFLFSGNDVYAGVVTVPCTASCGSGGGTSQPVGGSPGDVTTGEYAENYQCRCESCNGGNGNATQTPGVCPACTGNCTSATICTSYVWVMDCYTDAEGNITSCGPCYPVCQNYICQECCCECENPCPEKPTCGPEPFYEEGWVWTGEYITTKSTYPGCESCNCHCDPWELICKEKKYEPIIIPECGNGIRDAGEQCDPVLDGPSCSANCTWAKKNCGDSVWQYDEYCEKGDPVGVHVAWDSKECDQSKCEPKKEKDDGFCGDGIIDAGEECDPGKDGTGNRDTSCTADCKRANDAPYCGNGQVDNGEVCDYSAPGYDRENCTEECEPCDHCVCEDLECDVEKESAYRSTVQFSPFNKNNINNYKYEVKGWSGITTFNPTIVTATYYNLTTSNYQNLEALYFWMAEVGESMDGGIQFLNDSVSVSQGSLKSNNNFGFMLKKTYTSCPSGKSCLSNEWKSGNKGNYEIYLPQKKGSYGLEWVKYDDKGLNSSFYIYGANGKKMVLIEIENIEYDTDKTSYKEKVKLVFKMTFLNSDNLPSGVGPGEYEQVPSAKYQVYSMALNEWMFTTKRYYERYKNVANDVPRNLSESVTTVGPDGKPVAGSYPVALNKLKDNEIRNWEASHYRKNGLWGVDLDSPVVGNFTSGSGNALVIVGNSGSTVNANWKATDIGSGVVYSVMNGYRILDDSEVDDQTLLRNAPITYKKVRSSGTIERTGVLTLQKDYDESKIGFVKVAVFPDTIWSKKEVTEETSKNNYLTYPTEVEKSSDEINLGNNRGGTIRLFLTVFDQAGNTMQTTVTYGLSEWIQTAGGLFYSKEGTNFNTRVFKGDSELWTGNMKSLFNRYNITEKTTNIATEVMATSSDKTTSLYKLSSATDTAQFYKYAGLDTDKMFSTYTSQMLQTYRSYVQTENGSNPTTGAVWKSCEAGEGKCSETWTGRVTTISGLNSIFNNNRNAAAGYYVDGDLTIGENSKSSTFVCDGRVVVVVNGRLNIYPNITNENPTNACVFIARGDVHIYGGKDSTTDYKDSFDGTGFSSNANLVADELHAFILTDGVIVLEKEEQTSLQDPLFVEGGLVSFTKSLDDYAKSSDSDEYQIKEVSSSIVLRRVLDVTDRNMYPVLSVVQNPKYGKAVEEVLGAVRLVYQTEVGFKVY
ncbi:hypothetical protein J6Z48_00595 [bacterium]|nr:hypothetical protein [bacterium]